MLFHHYFKHGNKKVLPKSQMVNDWGSMLQVVKENTKGDQIFGWLSILMRLLCCIWKRRVRVNRVGIITNIDANHGSCIFNASVCNLIQKMNPDSDVHIIDYLNPSGD